MTYGDMRTYFWYLINDPSSNIWTAARTVAFFNTAQQTVAKWIEEEDEDYFITSTTHSVVAVTDHTDQTFSLPSDFRRHILFERVRTGERATALPLVKFRYRDAPLEPLPGPHYDALPYVSIQGTLVYVIDAQETFTMKQWYVKRLADFTATGTTATTDIPAEFHDLVCYVALVDALISEGTTGNRLDHAKARMNEMRSDLKRNVVARQVQQPTLVRRSYGY